MKSQSNPIQFNGERWNSLVHSFLFFHSNYSKHQSFLFAECIESDSDSGYNSNSIGGPKKYQTWGSRVIHVCMILPYCANSNGNVSARHVKISQNEQAHKCGHFELGIGHIRAISAEIRSYHIMYRYYICGADM